MKRLQAFRYELMPTGGQRRQIRSFAGSCRFVYNKALALQKELYNQGDKKLGYASLCRLLTEWRNSAQTPWLKDAPTHPLQQSLKDLERAYSNFFAGWTGFPRLKKKGRSESFRYPDTRQIKLDQPNCRIFLPKLGWLRYRNSRPVLGEVRQVTVSGSGEKWFVSIQTECELQALLHPSGSMVGVAAFATLSDGQVCVPINSYRKRQKRLAFLRRRLRRKTKFSNNWKKANARVRKLHTKVANCRRDFLHKTPSEISKNHAVVVLEDLAVENMARSAAGTVEQPGRNVNAKSGLNRAILDQGWSELRRQLDYKERWRGGSVVVVPAKNTSRTCPGCGHSRPGTVKRATSSSALHVRTRRAPTWLRRATF
jgi:putative transposase